MKNILIILVAVCVCLAEVAVLRFTLKDGEVVEGQLICEMKGRLTLKTANSGTVSVWKKSIELFGEQRIAGAREFMLGKDYLLINKNEIAFIIVTQDDARVKLREVLADGSEKLIGEQSGKSGDTLVFFVPDGRYYEAVEYTRGDTAKYYGFGGVFAMKSKCESFAKAEVALRGFVGDRIPQLRGDVIRFKRDGE